MVLFSDKERHLEEDKEEDRKEAERIKDEVGQEHFNDPRIG